MAKKSTPVNRKLLERSLQEAETEGPLPNLNDLWNKTANIYNQSSNIPITFSIVCLRVKEWNIQVKTKPGKRGRTTMTEEQKQAMREGRTQRTTRKDKLKNIPTFNILKEQLQKDERKIYLPIIEKAQNGSLRAAIKLHCLACCGYDKAEVKLCNSTSCAIFPHKPYKHKELQSANT